MTTPERIAAYARVLVHVGVGLQHGQRLLMTGYRGGLELESVELVRACATEAWAAGASLVTAHFEDATMQRERVERIPVSGLGELAAWELSVNNDFEPGRDVLLVLDGSDPLLLSDVPAERRNRARERGLSLTEPGRRLTSDNAIAWCVARSPTPDWARAVYPDDTASIALDRIWADVARAARLDEPDPVAASLAHGAALGRRAGWLTGLGLTALHLRGGGTDLTLPLATGHVWRGGRAETHDGQPFSPNLPTEEVFTAPARDGAEGVLAGTMPVMMQGEIVAGWRLRFRAGVVIEAHADRGKDALRSLLDLDEGARRLGEIALVPADGRTGAGDVLYLCGLYDENRASHVALGDAYPDTAPGSEVLNSSLEHSDVMWGSPAVAVDGVTATGATVPLMRDGLWVERL